MAKDPDTMTPKEAADIIGVTAQSVRRYTQRFSRFLSPGASPEPGHPRTLTPEDVYILQFVADQTRDGQDYDTVEEMLETLPLPETVELPAQETVPQVPEGLAVLSRLGDTLDRVEGSLTALSGQVTETNTLHHRLDQLQAENREIQTFLEQITRPPTFWRGVAIGVVLGVLLGVLLVLVGAAIFAGAIQ